MAADNPENTGETRDSLAERRTRLAELRNQMAAERTLMGWIRTSVSLIGFGFSISQFFQFLHKMEPERVNIRMLQEPFFLGVVLVGFGTLTLIIAVAENYFMRQGLSTRGYLSVSRWSLASVFAIVFVLIGLVLFIVLLRSM